METKQSNTPAAQSSKHRWSAIDTVILLLMLAAIAGIVYRIVITVTDDGDPGTRCRVYFEVEETHRDVLDGIQGFDEVYLLENDMLLGSIGATSMDPETGKGVAALTVKNAEGSDMATASGCMVCCGTLAEGGSLLVGETGQYLSRGSVLTVRTDRVVLTIRVTDIK